MTSLILNGTAAGFLIGIGVIINSITQNPVLGALLFSFGLLTIIDLKLPLFTGQIGFIKEKRKLELLAILITNLIGISLCFVLYGAISQDFLDIIMEKGLPKFDRHFIDIFIRGFFCGTLIHFAVKCKKQLITVFAIMIFILMGAEHCIADFPYFIVSFNFPNTIKFLLIILGNSLGAICIEQLTMKE